MTTLVTLYRKTLENIGVVDADTPADGADTQLVAGKYANLYQMLLTEGLVAWSATEDIPDYAEIPLVWLLSRACAAAFGDDPGRYDSDAAAALPLLRRQLAKKYVSHPAQSEYF